MSSPTCNFAWYELMTTDTAAAGAFYSSVVGWTTKDVSQGSMTYFTFNLGAVGIAGLMTLPEEAKAMNHPPSWIGYIHVPDVDAYGVKVVEAGGKILKPATDVPGMLRFIVVADLQGTPFVIFTSNPNMPTPTDRPLPPTPGTVGWHELYAGDLEPAFTFYSTLFGWDKVTDMDMGPMGIYRIFGYEDKQVGGMMTKTPNVPVPCWGFYFQVDAISAAIERIKAGGGSVVNGPMQVPGGSWIVQGVDPQGAMFSLVSFEA
ncbi:VOC family protein [Acidicapsa acidisoli]|uniref:VOC family protein n=1 Tax=Acidicapsa acidisoli TaxID=1615681 RepID=UPI0021E0794B|nr:VOC family protein [Acidicapsa acidisoli]